MEASSEGEAHKELEIKHANTKTGSKYKKALMVLLVLLLMAASAGGGWWWRDRDSKKLDKFRTDTASSLNSHISTLQKQLADAQKSAKSSTSNTLTPACVGASAPSASNIENIQASIVSGNTAALGGYMASSVNVILAASEAYGPQTQMQAINDVTSFINGSGTWDFNLPASVLSSYGQSPSYAKYFPNNAVVGKSSNHYVISFSFTCNKISTIFLTNDESIIGM